MRRVDRLFLQPPWNLGIFFALYTLFFLLLVQKTFAVSVIGQVAMGTGQVTRNPTCLRSWIRQLRHAF